MLHCLYRQSAAVATTAVSPAAVTDAFLLHQWMHSSLLHLKFKIPLKKLYLTERLKFVQESGIENIKF